MKFKNKIFLAAALLCLSMSACAWAAPNNFSVQADELEYDLQTGEGEAKGHVVIHEDAGNATADYAKFNSNNKTGVLTGNVVADRGDMHIVCHQFIAHNEDDLSAIGLATVSKAGKSLSADRIDYFQTRQYAETVGNWARLVDADGSVLDAAKIEYDIEASVATALGGVKITSEARQLNASADKAIYKTDNNGYVELIGNAKATQNGNSVAGDKLRLTNTNMAMADGNVDILYIPEKQPALAPKENEQGVA